MEQKMNQAVLFTKPVRHLALPLTSEELDEKARRYFEAKGFNFILSKRVTGSELAGLRLLATMRPDGSPRDYYDHLDPRDPARRVESDGS